jgi:chromosome segregation ATPase
VKNRISRPLASALTKEEILGQKVEVAQGNLEEAQSSLNSATELVRTASSAYGLALEEVADLEQQVASSLKSLTSLSNQIKASETSLKLTTRAFNEIVEKVDALQAKVDFQQEAAASAASAAQALNAKAAQSKVIAANAMEIYKKALGKGLIGSEKALKAAGADLEMTNLTQSKAEINQLKIAAEKAQNQYKSDLEDAAAAEAQSKKALAIYNFTKASLAVLNKDLVRMQSKLSLAEKQLQDLKNLQTEVTSKKNTLTENLQSAKAKAIAAQNALTAAQVKAQSAKVKVIGLQAKLNTEKKNLKNLNEVTDASEAANDAIASAEDKVDSAAGDIDGIENAGANAVRFRSLPLILTIVGVVAIATFFASLAIKRSRRRSDEPEDFEFELDLPDLPDFPERMPTAKKAVAKRVTTKKAPAKKAIAKKAVVKKAPTKKALAKKAVAKKTPAKKAVAKRSVSR